MKWKKKHDFSSKIILKFHYQLEKFRTRISDYVCKDVLKLSAMFELKLAFWNFRNQSEHQINFQVLLFFRSGKSNRHMK